MLNVNDVHLNYGEARALRGVNFTAEEGKITCILGRNGVGKTSLIRALVGHEPLVSGEMIFNGKPLGKSASFERARAGIALVPQGREIFPLLTVRENLETGYALLKPSQRSIPDYVFDLFPILKDMLHRRGGDLSGGQQQQLAIGRALVMRPKLLALDEPTEGIQPSIIKDIGRAIQFLKNDAGVTILLIEQYLDFCRELADTVHIMDRGVVVHSGEAHTLDDPNVRKHLTV